MRQANVTRRLTVRTVVGREHGYGPEIGTRDLRDVPVAALMGTPAITVWLGDSLGVALRTLAVHGVRHLAVVDGAGQAVGMLTDRIVTAYWAMRPMTFESVRVADVHPGPTPFVTVDATIADVARVMRRCVSDAAVVVDAEGRPVGVVTTSDLVAVLAKPRPE
jgi:CBS domain-containing protein